MFGVTKQEKQQLEEMYLNKQVHVIINDPYSYTDAVGTVQKVDDAGQLHGSWGGLAANPGEDTIELM